MSDHLDFDFDAAVDRRGTASYKWDKYQGKGVIPLWVADMDFRSPPAVIEALCERASHGVFGYGHAPEALEATVRAYLAGEYGWEIRPEWIIWLPGLVSGLNVLCRAVGAAGDEVATFTPVYPPFLSAPVLAGRRVVKVPLVEAEGRWEMDLAALERSLTPCTTLLLLCAPHNPVGRVWTVEELSELGALACRHDLVIGSDEIHAGLVLDEDKRHVPIATIAPEMAARTITLMAPSKTFNTPGLGCSFAIISDPALRMAFSRAMEGIVPHVNVMGYVAAQAAYQEGAEWHRALLDYLRRNRDLVEREIAAISQVSVAHVEATYLAWIDARRTGFAHPASAFEEVGVGLSDGADFEGPGFVRLNFGCNRALLEEALRRMRRALPG
ncbi:MAG: PatB family C-S lyase [Thermoleophilia bacterium]|nr:PatB family C-S lyase [Thermoleophilia bacterium]